MSYARNIEYLKKRSSNVSFDHIVGSPDFEFYDIGTSVDGMLVFEAGKGTKVFIHSRRDPLAEAGRQVESWIEKNNPALDGLVVVPGFGGMYHIKELASRLRPGGMLLVVEKYPGIIRKALDHCDLRKLSCAEGSCVVFIASESDEELKREYRHYLQTRKNLKVSVFIHPGLSRAFPGVYEALASLLGAETGLELMERNTHIVLGQKWIEHAICNIPAIFSSPGIESLRDRHKGSAAIMVAAGPSLDESVGYIGKVRNKVVVIAVGRSLKSLAEKGIKPDYIVTMDSDFITMQQFEGFALSDSVMLCDLITYPGVVSMFRDRRFFFSSGSLLDFEKWLGAAGVGVSRLAAGGTVAISAIDAARFLGCTKIFFMGLDLAFKDDGTTHAKGLQYKEKESGCGRIIQMKGNCRDWVSTSEQFQDYINMLNSYLLDVRREACVDFYNVTTQGAALSNCELVSPAMLEKVLDGCLVTAGPVRPPDTESRTDMPEKEKLLGHVQRSIAELRDAAVLANEMIDTCGVHDEKVDYRKAAGKIDRIEKNIKKMELANMLVTGALQGLLFKTMERSAAQGNEDARAFLKDFYSNYKGACEWVSRLLNEARESFEKDKELTY